MSPKSTFNRALAIIMIILRIIKYIPFSIPSADILSEIVKFSLHKKMS